MGVQPSVRGGDLGPVETADGLIALALRGEAAEWPEEADSRFVQTLQMRISDNGAGPLLHECKARLTGWPEPMLAFLRREAMGQAMWEVRHKAVLASLLAAMSKAGVTPILLKGTALAYLVYDKPTCRKRGDTDMLVSEEDLAMARSVLAGTGFSIAEEVHGLDASMRLQEVWIHVAADGSSHEIDLHWQVANSPVLEGILRFSDVAERLQPVPALSTDAFAPDCISLLIHACVHRANHMVSPYFVEGREIFEGNRLIWLEDIRLLCAMFSEADWQDLANRCTAMGVGPVCRDGLLATRDRLGLVVPDGILPALGEGGHEARETSYLLRATAGRRAWLDLGAIRGSGAKLAYLRSRIFPRAAFMRSKYPDADGWPLPLLYVRRMLGLLRGR